MKKSIISLMFFASLAMLTACGDKKAENSDAEESAQTENTEEESTGQTAGETTEAPTAKLTLEMDSIIPDDMKAVYANGDYTPCQAVFFKDDVKSEKVGEFPSKWNLNNGSAEVSKFDNQQVIFLANSDTEIAPKVVGESKNYLPDVFTIEFNYYCNGEDDYNACYHLYMGDEENTNFDELVLSTENNVSWNVMKPNDETIEGNFSDLSSVEKMNSWNHFAISFNKGGMKLYVNGKRVANLSGLKNPKCFSIRGEGWDDHRYYIKNIRMATIVPAE